MLMLNVEGLFRTGNPVLSVALCLDGDGDGGGDLSIQIMAMVGMGKVMLTYRVL